MSLAAAIVLASLVYVILGIIFMGVAWNDLDKPSGSLTEEQVLVGAILAGLGWPWHGYRFLRNYLQSPSWASTREALRHLGKQGDSS